MHGVFFTGGLEGVGLAACAAVAHGLWDWKSSEEGKNATSLQALLPKLSKLTWCPLPSQADLAPRCHLPRGSLPCNVGIMLESGTAIWDPVAHSK